MTASSLTLHSAAQCLPLGSAVAAHIRSIRRSAHRCSRGTAAAAASVAQQATAAPDAAHCCLILWDLDNIPVAHIGHAPIIGRRLLLAVQQHMAQAAAAPQAGGSSLPPCHVAGWQLTAYANERTLMRLAGEDGSAAVERALACIGARLVAVKVRR